MLHGRSIVGAAAALFLFTTISYAGSLSLAALNAGPSSASVPTGAADRVATVAYPRRIRDASVVPAFGAIYPTLTDARQVEAAGQSGIRWRSAALLPGNSFNNGRAEIAVVAQTAGFDATAADSFLLVLNPGDAAGITTPAGLSDFIMVNSPGLDYIRIQLNNSALGFTNSDLTEVNLAHGIVIRQSALDAAIPNGGGAVGQYREYQLAIVVLSSGPFTGLNDAVLTEWICLDNDGNPVTPADASFSYDNRTIRIRENQQILDDFDAANPADTILSNLSDADFRVLLSNGTTVQTLASFLAGLTTPNSVASVTIPSGDDQYHDLLEITLANEVANDTDIAAILATRIGTTGVDVDSITGNNQTNATSTYRFMDRPPCVGDIDGDGVIGAGDLNAILSVFNTASGDAGYNAAADLDDDDFIGFGDLNIVLSTFNTACP